MDPNSRILMLGASGGEPAISYTGNQSWNGSVATNFFDSSLNTAVAAPNWGSLGSNAISNYAVNIVPAVEGATLVEIYAYVPASANQNYHAYYNGANRSQLTETASFGWNVIYSGSPITLNNAYINMASPGGNNSSPGNYAIRVNGTQLITL